MHRAQCIKVLSLPPSIAPTKVLLAPLSNSPALNYKPTIQRLKLRLRKLGISTKVDESGASIGKKYSRNDELGTPLGITVDFQSISDNLFTLRDRDSTKQVRSDEDTICSAIKDIVEGHKTWADIQRELPEFTQQKTD